MNYWKVILATVVIFGTGVLTGGLLVNFVDHSHSRTVRHLPPVATNSAAMTGNAAPPKSPRTPEILSKQFVAQLNDELRFTPEQRRAIEGIIAESQGQMRKAVQVVRQGAREKIRDQLDSGQQRQFDELMKRSQKRQSNPAGPEPVAVEPVPTNAPGL